MRINHLLACSAVLLVATLQDGVAAAPLGQASLPAEMLGANWELVALTAGGTSQSTQGSGITISFNSDGSASGSAGCNNFRGSYTAGENAALTFGPLAATRKACEPAVNDRETAYVAALENVATYALNGSDLSLRSGDGATQLRYTRVTAAQLPTTGVLGGGLALLLLSAACTAAGFGVLRRWSGDFRVRAAHDRPQALKA